jgi:hypothetical protein
VVLKERREELAFSMGGNFDKGGSRCRVPVKKTSRVPLSAGCSSSIDFEGGGDTAVVRAHPATSNSQPTMKKTVINAFIYYHTEKMTQKISQC